MKKSYISSIALPEFALWDKIKSRRSLISFELELTARCNNNCRHCYINLPAGDNTAREKELTISEINRLADEAVSLGACWCLLTGGEPLLRRDFPDIYLLLKKKGLLVSVFTNANLITGEHIKLFRRYPPRDIEVSVYGVTEETYEAVTRTPGSYKTFMRGLQLLTNGEVKIRLKAMMLRSNFHEFAKISGFCRQKTKDYYRFDPFLHLRYDRDPERNRDIQAERLTPEEIVKLETSDPERFKVLENNIHSYIRTDKEEKTDNRLFLCGMGNGSFVMGSDGLFRLCSSLNHPDFRYDWRNGNLEEAWNRFTPRVVETRAEENPMTLECKICPIINLCLWCPAHAHLETGNLDRKVDYFCRVAHARAKNLDKTGPKP
jgi:radical SAM protein with 4Fe4S-binding SPASM domain